MMSLFSKCRRSRIASDSMHAYMNQYSRIRGSGRIQYACHRSSRKKTAVSRMWKKKKRSHCKEIHGISFSIPLFGWHQHEETTSSDNCLHHYGVDGTTACQGSSWSIVSGATAAVQWPHHQCWQAGWRRRWNSSYSYRIDQGELIKASTKRA